MTKTPLIRDSYPCISPTHPHDAQVWHGSGGAATGGGTRPAAQAPRLFGAGVDAIAKPSRRPAPPCAEQELPPRLQVNGGVAVRDRRLRPGRRGQVGGTAAATAAGGAAGAGSSTPPTSGGSFELLAHQPVVLAARPVGGRERLRLLLVDGADPAVTGREDVDLPELAQAPVGLSAGAEARPGMPGGVRAGGDTRRGARAGPRGTARV